MSAVRKMGSGLAFTPEKDLAMFADMAAEGKQLNGVAQLGHGWSFVDAVPEEVVFDLVYESDLSSDYFDIFTAAGWAPVLSTGDIHIFKAAPGTPPVHTTLESQRDELVRQRNKFTRYSLVTVAALVFVGLGAKAVEWNGWVEMALLIIFMVPVVYTVMPLFGYWSRARELSPSF